MNKPQHLIAIAILLGTLPLSQGWALSTDRDQPAEIEADDIEFDFKKGTRTYIDNVLIIQGSLRVKADKLIGIYKNDELETATAWGSLARFKQRPDGKDEDVEGWAKQIIVDQKQNTLTLIGKAALKQGANTARGETIVYNMANDTLQIKSGAKLQQTGKDGKTVSKSVKQDPFDDDDQGPTEPVPEVSNADTLDSDTQDPSDTAVKEAPQVDAEAVTTRPPPVAQPAPTRSGRSRLIIQPKQQTEEEPAEDDQTDDSKADEEEQADTE